MVSAPEVIADWLALSVAIIWACTPDSCSALSCSGPVRQPVHDGFDAGGELGGQCRHTADEGGHHEGQHAAERGEAADHHQCRGHAARHALVCSRWTAGESSAASSSATATGTTTAARYDATTPTTYSAATTTSSRHPSAAATRNTRGTTGTRRRVGRHGPALCSRADGERRRRPPRESVIAAGPGRRRGGPAAAGWASGRRGPSRASRRSRSARAVMSIWPRRRRGGRRWGRRGAGCATTRPSRRSPAARRSWSGPASVQGRSPTMWQIELTDQVTWCSTADADEPRPEERGQRAPPRPAEQAAEQRRARPG